MSNDGIRTWVEDPKRIRELWDARRREHDQRIVMDKILKRLDFDLPLAVDEQPYNTRRDLIQPFVQFETLSQQGFNVTRQVIDAGEATIVQELKANVTPIGADAELQRSCGKMSQAVAGVMRAADYWPRLSPQAYRGGCNSSLGTILWYVDGGTGEIQGDIVDSWHIVWSTSEGSNPMELLIERILPRIGLKAMFPKHAAAIDKLPKHMDESVPGVTHPGSYGADTVRVFLAWRRKHGEAPGKYIALGDPDLVLEEKDWPFSFFPTSHFRYGWDAKGFGGYAGARVLVPYHLAMNKLLRKAYDGFDGAVPHLLQNSLEPKQAFSTTAWRRIIWTNHKPEVVIPQPVSPAIMEEIARLESKAHIAFGANEAAARGTRPDGLNSAPSQREWRDIKNERMRRQFANFAQLARESSRAIIALASSAYKSKKVLVAAPGTRLFEEIKWPNLTEDKYLIDFDDSSGLPDTIAGKKEAIGEFRDRGDITEGEYMRLLGTPDLQAAADELSAPADMANQMIDDAINEAKFTMPDRMMGNEGLRTLVDKGARRLMRARLVKGRYSKAQLECLRQMVGAAEARLNGLTATAPIMPVPAVLPGQPAGVAPAPNAVLPPADPPA